MVYDQEIWLGRNKEGNVDNVLQMKILKKRSSDPVQNLKQHFDNKTPRFYRLDCFDTKDAIKEKQKKRPRNKLGIRFCPDHFPEGTVFRVTSQSAVVNFGTAGPKLDTFTVDHVMQSGPRTWLLVCKETSKHSFTSGDIETAWCFVLDMVEEIVQRGTGKLKIIYSFDEPEEDLSSFLRKNKVDNEQYYSAFNAEPPKLKRDEHVFNNHHRILNVVLKHIGLNPQNQGKFVNDNQFMNFMVTQNWGRTYFFYSDHGFETNFIFNVRKMKNWLKKNQHRVFFSLDKSAKQERIIIDSSLNELVDDDWL